ncbi:MAG: hypothetical protein GWN71_10540, partial [Gammaproteobacteria bacterium]|nr:hypothetical protein [Gemmatimonadota bacterium]NIU74000.1 hypothetical protein [Gammaproteobacteria bacterium]
MHQEADRWCAEGRERFPDVQHFVLCRLFFLGAVPELAPDVDWAWALVDSLALLATPDDRDTWRT